jgi:ATP-dependent protease Clp ATPase subunit
MTATTREEHYYDGSGAGEIPAALHCSFCGKNYQLAGRLIAGPGMCAICDSCIGAIASADSTRQELRGPLCHFCGKTQQEVGHITYGPEGAHICNECIALACEILAEEVDYCYKQSDTPDVAESDVSL